ncbi:MAG: hypothetical protein WBM41_05750 [Arenicellales bacterium]
MLAGNGFSEDAIEKSNEPDIKQSCVGLPEKSIVNAILNQEYDFAERLINDLNLGQAIIPSTSFYRALGVWHRGYQQADAAIKKKGIFSLRRSIKDLHKKPTSDSLNPRDLLALGISKGHTARALLENEQYLAGYEMGMEARQHILDFRSVSSETDIGYADTELLLGLFEVYTHDLLNTNKWLKGRMSHRGNREKGIDLIENAVIGDSIFAVEAMRALLAEVSWRTPEFCKYTEAIDYIGSEFPRNHDFAVLRQGLLLKCGRLEMARSANQAYVEQSAKDNILEDQIEKARFRILADSGDYQTLMTLSTNDNLDPYRQLAVANALDVADQRQQAYELYRSLYRSEVNPAAVKNVAKVRLRFPYRSPPRIMVPQFKVRGIAANDC